MTIHILVGTTSGNTEALADTLHQTLEQRNFQVQFHDQPELSEVPTSNTLWLVCVATHGAGEYADSIAGFMEDLASTRPDLSSVKIALIAVGDSSYDTFCQAGTDAENLLNTLGARFISNKLTIDMQTDPDPEQTALNWLNTIDDLN